MIDLSPSLFSARAAVEAARVLPDRWAAWREADAEAEHILSELTWRIERKTWNESRKHYEYCVTDQDGNAMNDAEADEYVQTNALLRHSLDRDPTWIYRAERDASIGVTGWMDKPGQVFEVKAGEYVMLRQSDAAEHLKSGALRRATDEEAKRELGQSEEAAGTGDAGPGPGARRLQTAAGLHAHHGAREVPGRGHRHGVGG